MKTGLSLIPNLPFSVCRVTRVRARIGVYAPFAERQAPPVDEERTSRICCPHCPAPTSLDASRTELNRPIRTTMLLATSYPFLEVFWTMLIFFAFVVWIWILFTVLADIFRRHDTSGFHKV